jgi:hypothetical protein
MRARTSIRRGLAVAVAAAGLFTLTGCQLVGKDNAADPTPGASAKATPTGSTKPSTNTDRPAGMPDVCTLLTKAEVASLSGGHQVTQIDPDGAADGAAVRHCQWQMSGARLAVFLSPTSAAEFRQTHAQAQKVTGVGDEAVTDSGHLYVRTGTTLIDVYATISGNDTGSARMAKSTALKLLEKL